MKKRILILFAIFLFLMGCNHAIKVHEENSLKSKEETPATTPEITPDVTPEIITEVTPVITEASESPDVNEKEEETSNALSQDVPKEEADTMVVPTSTSSLSNSTCAWGFVRKKDEQKPEFYGPHAKVLDAYQGIYCAKGNDKVIYLTMDEGYENGYTASILDTLKEKNVKIIFFVTMPYVKQNPDLVRRMIDEGHLVGNHTVNHPSMPEITSDEKLTKEIMELHDYVKVNFDYEMSYLRPPKGEYSERTVKLALDLGYHTVLWSGAYDDWDTSKQDRLDYARGMILNYIHPGEVMLLHAVSKDNDALLGEVIDTIRAKGYEFATLDEF